MGSEKTRSVFEAIFRHFSKKTLLGLEVPAKFDQKHESEVSIFT